MNLLDLLPSEMDTATHMGKIYGVVIGIVTKNKDEDNLGRVKVRFPWLVNRRRELLGPCGDAHGRARQGQLLSARGE